MLYTASFYEPAHWLGVRYRVSRGHPRGRPADWSTQPFLYPSRELLREYQGGGIDFPALDVRYREELETTYDAKAEFRTWLQGLPLEGDVTLLCFEPAGKPCHRRLAAAWLLEWVPGLDLGLMR